MALTHLEIINNILTAIDLPPVNSASDDSYEVQQINDILSQQKRLILAKGYFFNTFDQEFVNTNDNKVFVTDDVLKVDSTKYSLRGRQLWDLVENSGKITEPVTIATIVDLDFSQLPYECAFLIMCKARTLVQTKMMPDVQTTQIYTMEEQQAKRLFNEYVLESYNANMLDSVTNVWQR